MTMKTKSFVIAFFFPLASLMAEPAKPATFEIRRVIDAAAQDTEEMSYRPIHPGGEKPDDKTLRVEKSALIDGTAIKTANALDDPAMGHVVQIAFTEDGTTRFAEATRAHVWKRLAFLIDGKVRSAPFLAGAITNGKVIISGLAGKEEAEELAARLRVVAEKNSAVKP